MCLKPHIWRTYFTSIEIKIFFIKLKSCTRLLQMLELMYLKSCVNLSKTLKVIWFLMTNVFLCHPAYISYNIFCTMHVFMWFSIKIECTWDHVKAMYTSKIKVKYFFEKPDRLQWKLNAFALFFRNISQLNNSRLNYTFLKDTHTNLV